MANESAPEDKAEDQPKPDDQADKVNLPALFFKYDQLPEQDKQELQAIVEMIYREIERRLEKRRE